MVSCPNKPPFDVIQRPKYVIESFWHYRYLSGETGPSYEKKTLRQLLPNKPAFRCDSTPKNMSLSRSGTTDISAEKPARHTKRNNSDTCYPCCIPHLSVSHYHYQHNTVDSTVEPSNGGVRMFWASRFRPVEGASTVDLSVVNSKNTFDQHIRFRTIKIAHQTR